MLPNVSEFQQRHITVCQKAAMKKRKVFDSAKQRAAGTDIVLPKNRPKPGQPPPVRSARAPTGSQSAVRLLKTRYSDTDCVSLFLIKCFFYTF